MEPEHKTMTAVEAGLPLWMVACGYVGSALVCRKHALTRSGMTGHRVNSLLQDSEEKTAVFAPFL